jgi:hypothetical protein
VVNILETIIPLAQLFITTKSPKQTGHSMSEWFVL